MPKFLLPLTIPHNSHNSHNVGIVGIVGPRWPPTTCSLQSPRRGIVGVVGSGIREFCGVFWGFDKTHRLAPESFSGSAGTFEGPVVLRRAGSGAFFRKKDTSVALPTANASGGLLARFYFFMKFELLKKTSTAF